MAAGESACSPLSVSLISDLYSDRQRGLATGILHLGVYLGFGMSQVRKGTLSIAISSSRSLILQTLLSALF